MLILVETVRSNPHIERLEISGFLFALFTCGIRAEKAVILAEQDYLWDGSLRL